MDMLLKLAIVIFGGYLAGRLAKIAKLSNIFGYVIAGIILGPSCLKLLSNQNLTSLTIISEMAVAILAFKVGSEFVVRDMRKLGKSFAVITVTEVIGTVLIGFSVTYFLFQQSLVFSLILASLAAVTAPAATIMVMRQYRADGPVTRTLLPVIALDGVLGVVLFGIAISIASVVAHGIDISAWQMVSRAAVQIFGGLALGTLFGLGLTFFGPKAGDSDELLVITIAIILACTGVAKVFTVSPLLANVMMGLILVNLTQNSNRIFFGLNQFMPPLYVLFFTLAGASFYLPMILEVGLLILGYPLARAAGKLLGSWIGARGVKAEPTVQKYLGAALLPQGGLTIALATLVKQYLPDISMAVMTIIILTVLLYEIVGASIAKTTFQMAGEIRGMGSTIR